MRRPRRQGGKFVLPSDAQWEYACRAGTTTQYSFGDDESQLPEYGWYQANSQDTTHPVGEKKPNAWGLYDMHGNVLGWCQDWFEDYYYAISPMDDPTGPFGGSLHICRGGSWTYSASNCRSAKHEGDESDQYTNLGLRVAMVVGDTAAERAKLSRVNVTARALWRRPTSHHRRPRQSPSFNPRRVSPRSVVLSLPTANGYFRPLVLPRRSPPSTPRRPKTTRRWAGHLGVPVEITAPSA